MPLNSILFVSLMVAYFWTGWEMVEYHKISHPIDRPGYVREGWATKMVSWFLWPVVAARCRELGWFAATLAGTTTLLALALYWLVPLRVPVWLIVAAIPALRMLPIVSNVLNVPIAIFTTAVFFVLFRPFGAKMPSGMNRYTDSFD